MNKIDIAGLKIDNVTTAQTLDLIRQFVLSGQPHHIVTAYSEFVVEAQDNAQSKLAMNNAALVVPDGIGILWAAKFLSMPVKDMVVTYFNWLGSLLSIVLSPQSVRTVITEQVTGRKLIWDIVQLAQQNNFSLSLVGGADGVAAKCAQVLQKKYPQLKINLAISDNKFDQAMVQNIAQSNTDILLIAFQPPQQEIWLSQNLQQLNIKVAIGLGGTFDYIAGKRVEAPEWIHYIGLEWLWRLVTQPWRLARMWRATAVFSWLILQKKLQNH